ncbi:MAG: DUF2752 domain-containing protein [Saccharofermentanales bacterium]
MEADQDRGKKKAKRGIPPLVWVLLSLLLLLLELVGGNCFFSSVLGIPCAGCGTSRAAILLFGGHFREALRMHPLILVTLALVLTAFILLLAWLFSLRSGKPLRLPLSPRAARFIFFSLLALYLAVYLVRMILYFPDQEPLCYQADSVWGRLIALIRLWTGR